MKTINIKDAVKKNRRVNAEQLTKGLKLLEELQSSGIAAAGYRVVHPFAKRRAAGHRAGSNDPRAVHLDDRS